MIKSIFEEAKQRIFDVVRFRLTNLKKDQAAIVEGLENEGLVIIPDFLSEEDCTSLREWIDHEIESNQFIWRDSVASDSRIFFANLASQQVSAFFQNLFIREILSVYEGKEDCQGFTLANKLVFKEANKGSGGGWHRDFVKRRQTKAILYLSDVTEATGPFQFLVGSHRFESILHMQYRHSFAYNQFRFSEIDVEAILNGGLAQMKTVVGRAGTLLLADTRGIHRGAPLRHGSRYALTNYYWFGGAIPQHMRALNPYKAAD